MFYLTHIILLVYYNPMIFNVVITGPGVIYTGDNNEPRAKFSNGAADKVFFFFLHYIYSHLTLDSLSAMLALTIRLRLRLILDNKHIISLSDIIPWV